ncbi:MAG: type II toxin-antitoxin system antitoxin SocA domain-containing protein [candidate division FCPU426 bacterium]
MPGFNKNIGKRIKSLRESRGISQQSLADHLGVVRPTISQIENGSRALSVEELKKVSEIFGVSVESILDLSKEPQVVLEPEEEHREAKPEIRINVPQRNLKKFKEILLYILGQVGSKPNMGESVIYKLLYFMDFDYYERFEEQLIGATYIKNHHGPTPREFKTIVDRMVNAKEIERVKSKYFNYPQTKYLPLREPDLSGLKATEKEIIDDVICRLGDKNAKQMEEYSHGDVPWMTAEEGKNIEYEAVFYRTAPYSVRKSDDSIQ